MTVKKIVIIGGGVAGLSAAQAARETDAQAEIHLVCGEGRLPYYRPRICERFTGLPEEKLAVHDADWYAARRINTVFARATTVNRETRQVRLNSGESLPYDALVIATGARGNIPEARGNDRQNVFALRTLADIDRLAAYTGPVVIVGDGLLGLEAAWHLSRSGRAVTIIGRNDRLLSRQLDKEGSVFFLRLVEEAGVHVALNGELTLIDEQRAVLADGRAFEAAAVVFAAGIKSVTNLAAPLGLEVGRAIRVDERMQCSQAGVYAAGDCAELAGHTAGLWTVSNAQGAVAGANAAGGDRIYQPEAPSYLMNAMGTQIWSYGAIDSEEAEGRRLLSAGRFGKLFFRASRLVGAELIGTSGALSRVKKAVDAGLPRDAAEELWHALELPSPTDLIMTEERRKTMKYKCDVCGYIYDPAENDGVEFADLPEDFTCPVCGVSKDNFSPVE